MSKIEVWNGSAWVEATGKIFEYWDGSKWAVPKEVEYWNGSKWGVHMFSNARYYATSTHTDSTYELSLDNVAMIINTKTVLGRDVYSHGGIAERLFQITGYPSKAYELNVDTLTILNTVDITGITSVVNGLGGTATDLLLASSSPDKIWKLNPDTFAVISTHNAPAGEARGIGGMETRPYMLDKLAYKRYELNPSTLAKINEASQSGDNYVDIGGVESRVFQTNSYPDTIEELNPDTLAIILTTPTSYKYSCGSGGTK